MTGEELDVPLNVGALERLRRLGGDALVGRMIDLFLVNSVRRMETARAGRTSGDLPAVAQAVHSLKSSAGNLGAHDLQRIAQEIETHAGLGEAEQVDSLFPELESAFSTAHSLLAAERSSLPR